jgi:hypothetical protein
MAYVMFHIKNSMLKSTEESNYFSGTDIIIFDKKQKIKKIEVVKKRKESIWRSLRLDFEGVIQGIEEGNIYFYTSMS